MEINDKEFWISLGLESGGMRYSIVIDWYYVQLSPFEDLCHWLEEAIVLNALLKLL